MLKIRKTFATLMSQTQHIIDHHRTVMVMILSMMMKKDEDDDENAQNFCNADVF